MKKLKESGITLVALVVTIIILLIIISVSIASAIGSNGIIEKTQASTQKYKDTENEERDDLVQMSNKFQQHNEEMLPKPTVTIALSGDTTQESSPTVQANVDQQSDLGIDTVKCKWTVNNNPSKIGTDENLYNNTFSINPETISVPLSEGKNYIHILTTTSYNTKSETVSSLIDVTPALHKHSGDTTNGGPCYQTEIHHQHGDSCYGPTEYGYFKIKSTYMVGNMNYNNCECSRCGWTQTFSDAQYYSMDTKHCSGKPLTCTINTSTILGYQFSCTKTENVSVDFYTIKY